MEVVRGADAREARRAQRLERGLGLASLRCHLALTSVTARVLT